MKNLLLPLLLGAGTITGGIAATTPVAAPPAAPRYDVRGIFDPGLGGVVAFALKVPHGWQLQQSFTRSWMEAYPTNQIYVGVVAPDGHTRIEYLPETSFHYGTGPTAVRNNQQMAQYSGHADPTWLAPMTPLDYLKKVFVPRLTQKTKLQPRITAEHQDPIKNEGQGMQTGTAYVDCVLPSGRKLRIISSMHLLTGRGADGPIYNWGADAQVVQSDTDLPGALATSAAVQKSLVPNPAWQRQDQALRDKGQQQNHQQTMANLDKSFQRFQQNVQHQQAQRAAINSNFQRQQRASGQVASAYADYMGDQTLVENPATGERTKVQSGYSHVYQDAQGTTLSTNAPLNPSHVDWQELQQVEVKNY